MKKREMRTQIMGVCLAALLIGLPATCFAAKTHDLPIPSLQFQIHKSTNGQSIRFAVENLETAHITVTFELSQTNLKSPIRFPYTVTVPPRRTLEAFHLSPVQSEWRYTLTYHALLGSQCAMHEASYVYSLPYTAGQTFRVSQAYNGTFSHTGAEQYAIDWRMPSGTAVLAARSGVVVAVKDDSKTGGADKKFLSHANYILIEHRDGTIANYAHLSPRGARVKVGQEVKAGDVIGLSGNTGFSSGPHLHFCVFKTKDGKERQSVPIQFHTGNGPAVTLLTGKEYQAPETLLATTTPPGGKLLN